MLFITRTQEVNVNWDHSAKDLVFSNPKKRGLGPVSVREPPKIHEQVNEMSSQVERVLLIGEFIYP